MSAWIYAIISVVIISLVSILGIFTIYLTKKHMSKLLLFLVSLSTGTLFGGAFLHLLPEAFEKLGLGIEVGIYLLTGILTFFVLEKFIHWRHCHVPTSKSHPHPFAYMNLVGDALHNLIDGLIIGTTYLVSIPLGITTSLAVLFHEIPQEIGDFGVLIHGGFKKTKALFFNFLTATTAILGAILGLWLGSALDFFVVFIVPFTAGGFIYIAGSDLIPELHKESKPSRSLLQFIGIIIGIGIMVIMI
jgi:zinc and cadmium transporter